MDAAAFGQTPPSYDNACFAVIKSNGVSGPDLISQYRALGAPRAFEIQKDRVLHWKVTTSPSERDMKEAIEPHEIAKAFTANKSEWRPDSILRAKNIASPEARQLDFIDVGLIPALEQHVRDKISPLLNDVFHNAMATFKARHRMEADWGELCRLVFRSLTGKIMVDRRHHGFKSAGPENLLDRVARHYGVSETVLGDPEVQAQVVGTLWEGVSFENLTVGILAHVWENTLVSAKDRKERSIHATPSSIARYVVNRLPLETIPEDERRVVEPCCGSGTFLIAALQRLRDLLSPEMNAKKRHAYLKQRLTGIDIDDFGLEVARSSLTLADFPNPNGWQLENEDVFESQRNAPRYRQALSKARIILCNPPFAAFSNKQRRDYNVKSVHPPAEIVLRLLRNSPKDALVGLVLPRTFLDGRGYVEARIAVADRFDQFEIVSLPDKVFAHADHETALVMGQVVRRSDGFISLFHRKVSDRGKTAFESHYRATREDRADCAQETASETMSIPNLQEVWEHLEGCQTLRDVTDGRIHRGIEWNIPLTEKNPKGSGRRPIPGNISKLISQSPKAGFRLGFKDARELRYAYRSPETAYLNFDPEFRLYRAFELPWDEDKVILNAKTKSRGPWTIAAFADDAGRACYQTFTSLWPGHGWTATALACILNGPVACAFVRCHENKVDVKKTTLGRIPVPPTEHVDQGRLSILVERYLDASEDGLLGSATGDERTPRTILRQIDAIILKAYGLPPRLEHELLDYFRGHKRPVPFDFGDYYPEDFKPHIPLWMYDSKEFQSSTARNLLGKLPRITDPDLQEALADL